jgi:urea carboxylase
MWNRYRKTETFTQPWLLRFFDQIQFYPVSAAELQQIRRDFPLGNYPLKIEETSFRLVDYQHFLHAHSSAIETFQNHRRAAFDEELAQWKRDGQLTFQEADQHTTELEDDLLPVDTSSIDSPVSGNVWRVLVAEGDTVAAGDTVMIIESMKMEIEIHAAHSGNVQKIVRQQGQPVTAGQALLWLDDGDTL